MPWGDYKVLETDNINYTVIYTCMGLPGIYNIEYAWILTRDPVASDEVMDKALAALAAKAPEYDISALYATPQGADCPYQTAPQSEAPMGWTQAFLQ